MAEKFIKHTGLVVPLDAANVDTDAIIPKQFLQKVTRTGFGAPLFNDWRFRDTWTWASPARTAAGARQTRTSC